MKIRMLLAAVALVGFGAFASSCNDDGGGGTLTLQEYFEKVGKLDDEHQTKSDAVNEEVDALGEDATPDDVADSFEKQVDLLEDFGNDFDDINPPDEVKDAHERVLTALDGAREQFNKVIGEFREADSVEEAFGALDDSDFSEIENANEACRELEQIAADNDIEADFNCDEDEE